MANHPNGSLRFSAEDEIARLVCEALSLLFDARFVEAAVARSGHIVAGYTLGKPHEVQSLRTAVGRMGWCWQRLDARRPTDPRPWTLEAIKADDRRYEWFCFLRDEEVETSTWAEYAQRLAAESAAECARQAAVNATVRAA